MNHLMAWKTLPATECVFGRGKLQWGHALMAWKTEDEHTQEVELSDASMGPRFNGVEDEAIADGMKTRSSLLQWGHALMAWKTKTMRRLLLAAWGLQWGHALMAWKTMADMKAIIRVGSSFNGATL